jgi:hypothetical protein
MSEKKVVSLADLRKKEVNNVKYDTVEAYGTTVRIGSVSSADMLEWVEGNADPAKKKISGLRLLVKSVTDDTGARYQKEEYDAVVEDFKNKDAQENGKVLAKVLVLNGFPVPKELTKEGEKPADPHNPEATTAARKND